MWLVILIVVVIIGSIIGAISSKDGEKGAGCLGGALTSGLGCGYVLLQILFGELQSWWLYGFSMHCLDNQENRLAL